MLFSTPAPLLAANSPSVIPNEYIVVFNKGTSDEEGKESMMP